MKRAEMRKLGAGGQVQKFDRLRQIQQRRRGEQEIIGQRKDGADRAELGRVLVVMVVSRPLRLRGIGMRVLYGEGRGDREIGVDQSALNGWRRPRGGNPMEMPQRQRKLDRERKQRQPRAVLEVLSEPVHETCALSRGSPKHPGQPMLHYNIGKGGGVSIVIPARPSDGPTIQSDVGFVQQRRPCSRRFPGIG